MRNDREWLIHLLGFIKSIRTDLSDQMVVDVEAYLSEDNRPRITGTPCKHPSVTRGTAVGTICSICGVRVD